jgi:hypothetical protein
MLSSIPAGPAINSAVQRLRGYLADLPAGATGALSFGSLGVILLQNRKICWAMERGMRLRLTDILRNQSTPPVSREAVEQVYRQCKTTGTPIGEALVASGLASEAGLRAALFKHNGEALVALARAGAAPDDWVTHTKPGYDPKYSFSACEMLAMLGAVDDPARATAAQLELGDMLVPESVGAAFTRSSDASGALVIAVDRSCDFAVADLVGVCNWVAGLFDVAQTFDHEVFAARANFGEQAGLVTWRLADVGYVGLCASRAAAARLVSRLSERGVRTSGVMPRGTHERENPA